MAIANLSPYSGVYLDWSEVTGGGDYWTELRDTDDATGIRNSTQGRTCIVTLDDTTFTDETIDSIRWYVRGVLFNTRGGDSEIQVRIAKGGHTETNVAVYNYDETVNIAFNAGYAKLDYYGTARTTSDGGTTPWNYANLDGMRLDINTSPENPPGVSRVWIVKAAIEVTFTLGAAVTHNATFFGANF